MQQATKLIKIATGSLYFASADESPFSIEQCLVSVWADEEGRSGRTCDEIRAKFAA
jgi:hypothetical protein